MRLGIILSIDSQISSEEREKIFSLIQKNLDIKYCLLNTEEEIYTENTLHAISQSFENIHYLNVQKRISEKTAVRAGSRYLQSLYNFDYIGHILNKTPFDLFSSLECLIENYHSIMVNPKVFFQELNKSNLCFGNPIPFSQINFKSYILK